MKIKTIGILLSLLSVVLMGNISAFGQTYPKELGHVNDFAHVYYTEEVSTLSVHLKELQERTGYRLDLVTVDSIDGQSGREYLDGLADAWGFGKPDGYNGIIILVVPKSKDMYIKFAPQVNSILSDPAYGADLSQKGYPGEHLEGDMDLKKWISYQVFMQAIMLDPRLESTVNPTDASWLLKVYSEMQPRHNDTDYDTDLHRAFKAINGPITPPDPVTFGIVCFVVLFLLITYKVHQKKQSERKN